MGSMYTKNSLLCWRFTTFKVVTDRDSQLRYQASNLLEPTIAHTQDPCEEKVYRLIDPIQN